MKTLDVLITLPFLVLGFVFESCYRSFKAGRLLWRRWASVD
jgi:hypothetical protein